MRTPEEIEAFIALAKLHNLRTLKVDGLEFTRFTREPKQPPQFEASADEVKDPNERKREFYELAYGRPVSDDELALYPQAGL